MGLVCKHNMACFSLIRSYCNHAIRWQNMRHKNPQLDTQHCFVSCKFSSMFSVFHLVWSTYRARNKNICDKNICYGLKKVIAKSRARVYFWATNFGFVARFSSNTQLVVQQIACVLENQPISAPHFLTCNKCFCCGSSWSCKVKNRKHRRKLATKQCCTTSWGFLYLVFRCLYTCVTYKPCDLKTACFQNGGHMSDPKQLVVNSSLLIESKFLQIMIIQCITKANRT